MKTIEEIKDEYVANITIYDKFDSWHHYRAYNDIDDSDLDTICEQYAKQYIDRVKELEDLLKSIESDYENGLIDDIEHITIR